MPEEAHTARDISFDTRTKSSIVTFEEKKPHCKSGGGGRILQHDRQCTYDVTLKCFHVTNVVVENNKYYKS